MRGAPLAELGLVLLAAVFLFWPLQHLTRAPSAAQIELLDEPIHSENLSEAWLEIRASAAPERIRIYDRDQLLWEGGGALRMNADLQLDLSEGRKMLRIEFQWPEDVEQAYTEFVLEPDALQAQHQGFWSDEGLSRIWQLRWEELP